MGHGAVNAANRKRREHSRLFLYKYRKDCYNILTTEMDGELWDEGWLMLGCLLFFDRKYEVAMEALPYSVMYPLAWRLKLY